MYETKNKKLEENSEEVIKLSSDMLGVC